LGAQPRGPSVLTDLDDGLRRVGQGPQVTALVAGEGRGGTRWGRHGPAPVAEGNGQDQSRAAISGEIPRGPPSGGGAAHAVDPGPRVRVPGAEIEAPDRRDIAEVGEGITPGEAAAVAGEGDPSGEDLGAEARREGLDPSLQIRREVIEGTGEHQVRGGGAVEGP